jgi:hypothetical protein
MTVPHHLAIALHETIEGHAEHHRWGAANGRNLLLTLTALCDVTAHFLVEISDLELRKSMYEQSVDIIAKNVNAKVCACPRCGGRRKLDDHQ